MKQTTFIQSILFFRQREGQKERKRESQAKSPLSSEPDAEL